MQINKAIKTAIFTASIFTFQPVLAASLATSTDKFSYSIGVALGRNLSNQALAYNPDAIADGLKDIQKGNKLTLTNEQMQQILQNVQSQLTAKQAAKTQTQTTSNAKEEIAFLNNNAKQPGVKVLPSGLQYKILQAGNGVKPTANDTVTVNYAGHLINGKVFDSSYDRGQPAKFPVNGVILGWQQALKMMPVGSTWELYIPANLAYGEQGYGDVIGPNQTLIFKLQLLAVN